LPPPVRRIVQMAVNPEHFMIVGGGDALVVLSRPD
jgi:hypothetical protein